MRKKFLWTMLAAALFITLLPVTAYAENAVVTGDNVNLRSGPGMNYQVIEIVSRGDSLTVEDRSNDEWYAVTYNGMYGFISANLVSITENPSAVKVDLERAHHWIANGAQPTDTVKALLKKAEAQVAAAE